MGQNQAGNKYGKTQEVTRARAVNGSMSHKERSQNESAKDLNESRDECLCEGRSVLGQPMCTCEFGSIA